MIKQTSEISSATIKNWSKNWNFNIEKKLQNRANKRLSNKRFIPEEYIKYKELIELVYECFFDLGYTLEEILYSLILNLTRSVENIYLQEELSLWNVSWDRIIPCLTNFKIISDWDLLGWVYQSLLTEGEKNKKWAYYTPDNVVINQIKDHYRDGYRIIDPCCWTWQYLIHFPCNNPLDIWWADIDEIAVRIARINLMIRYPNFNFKPNVFHLDSLHESSKNIIQRDYFDIVVTNPPWWAKVECSYWEYSVKSWESFSYFIEMGFNILKKGGILSFILPESVLNVKTHEDIRRIMLEKQILDVYELWRIFSWVFTKVIRIDIKNVSCSESNILNVHTEAKTYQIDTNQFYKNPNYVFSIHIDMKDKDTFDKIYQRDCIFLNNNNALWALWIVTWDNSSFISDKLKIWFVPVYTWKEVKPYKLSAPSKYLLFHPEKFQQIASIERYTTSPKLIYKFISKRLVFALDEEGVYTLNSANIVIPQINYPIKVITALFNSELYQNIFQKKFNSIKVLKSHIQEMPLPILCTENYNIIEKLFDEVLRGEVSKEELDSYIFNLLIY